MLSEVSGKRCMKRTAQWGITDGNDTTPMEVDALMKGKGKNKGKGKGKDKGKQKGKEKGKAKSKVKTKEGTSDASNAKCSFCKEKGHARKDCPKSLGLAR